MNTYSDLLAAVESFIGQEGNTEVTSQIPVFVSLGEADIYRNLRHERMIVNYTVPDTEPYTIPSDCLEAAAVWVGYAEIDYVPANIILSNEASTDTPTQWSIHGSELLFNGVPNATTVLSYYAKPAELSTAVNAIFLQNPDVFLYAALSQAMIFLRDEQRQSVWATLYKTKLAELRATAWDARFPRVQPIYSTTR